MLNRIEVKSSVDLASLYPVISRIWREVFTPIIGRAQVDYMLENYQGLQNIKREIENGTHYYKLDYQGTCVGYTAYEAREDYLYISKLYIDQEHRGKGLMREIFDWYDKLSNQLDLKQVLRVNQGNKQAIAVYEHQGFQLIKEDVIDIGGGFKMDDFVFEKSS